MKELNQSTARALLKRLEDISDNTNYDVNLLKDVFTLFSLFFEFITDFKTINFTSLFARIVFSARHYQMPNKLHYQNHQFRKICDNQNYAEEEIESLCNFGLYLLWQNYSFIFKIKTPETYAFNTFESPFIEEKVQLSYQRVVRGILIEIKREGSSGLILCFSSEDEPHIVGNYKLIDEKFCKQLLKIEQYLSLPIPISLVDVNQDGESSLVNGFVLKPDFLVGVTTISECFQSEGHLALAALANKLIPTESSKHMLLGNVVNYFLDELIHNEDLQFKQVLPEVFKLSPLTFAGMQDEELREFIDKLAYHFSHLKRLVSAELQEVSISKELAFLEPSFYSIEYGIQGRLDLYHFNQDQQQSDIVELKSGRLFKVNSYGLNENHYVQTLLYDLLIESMHKAKVKSNNYILYSLLEEKNLRFAPRIRSKQLEAIYLRNDILFIEDILSSVTEQPIVNLLSYLDAERIPSGFNFISRDAVTFRNAFDKLNRIERSYYIRNLGFVNREYNLSKVGVHGIGSDNGLASLWLNNISQKVDNYRILSFLNIFENRAGDSDPIIRISFSEKSSRLSRFRIGDIAVFYPDDDHENSVLRHQIFKCTITHIDNESIEIRLRSRQKNFELFDRYRYWHIEEDSLDSSYLKQFYSLFHFISASSKQRKKLLTLEEPEKYEVGEYYSNNTLTDAQARIVNQAISSKDYFLLWGPPGTGKTSIMINALVDYYFHQTESNILLLAYTNRAVDEICESIDQLVERKYLRFGSRYSTHPDYQDKLFSQVSEHIDSRKGLYDLILNTKIFVSTISSFQGMQEINSMKQFDLVIVDEASQILEPMIVGLLSRFRKFILIGDHKQLPAVVRQKKESCIVQDSKELNVIGIYDLSNSLFERMYSRCMQQSWNWAYAKLYEQGRMHDDILRYVSQTFYNSGLKSIRGIQRLNAQSTLKAYDNFSELLIAKRMLFIDVPVSNSKSRKVNLLEAQMVIKMIDIWKRIYSENNLELDRSSIGVITPFRSQIALISGMMESDVHELVTVDTVERYQGGARDRIIISLAVSQSQLLDSIMNISEEGIDRKLNVALTRAKENLIIFGNREVLVENENYRTLIENCHSISFLDID